MKGSTVLVAGLVSMAVGSAVAEPLAVASAMPLAEALNSGYAVVQTSPNGRSGEVVMILRKENKALACVLTDLRGEAYGEAKAKPAAQPCLPLN